MSDDEEQFNAKSHKNLLQAISSLGKVQHIRKTTRDEASQRVQDEFQLVKSTDKLSGGINDIVQILKTTEKHLDTGKKFKNVQTTKKVLDTPLEKPAADRIKRTIGYEGAKKQLGRWDAIVAKNRTAETQVFPLKSETIYIDTSAHAKPLQRSLKSELQLEMEAAEAKLKALKKERDGDNEDEKTLDQREAEALRKKITLDELIARRRELAYLKMRESQKAAKTRMQKKIKSKKYHKLMKRQKLQAQIKEFELLQKTNPEAALEKLSALERSRVVERANLRHKNTGTWAKNLQIRAKYDKDVRKDLAEQLQISRELTQKKQMDVEDEGEDSDADAAQAEAQFKIDEMEADAANDPFNPWTRVAAGGKAVTDKNGVEGTENWRKYWLARNENEKLLDEYKKLLKDNDDVEEEDEDKEDKDNKNEVKKEQDKVANVKMETESQQPQTKPKPTKKPKKEKKKAAPKAVVIENGWLVEELSPQANNSSNKNVKKSINIDDIFDEQEDKIRERLGKKLQQMSKQAKKLGKIKKHPKSVQKEKDELKNLQDLTFKQDIGRPIIDEALNHEELNSEATKEREALEKIANSNVEKPQNTHVQPDTIDPTQLATVKLKQRAQDVLGGLNGEMGDCDLAEDDDDDERNKQHQMTIAQAFEDDDIIADFNRDKTQDAELKNTEIQLSMPGWGSWAGAGLSQARQNAKRNKRLVLKLAEQEKRRDENKSGVYINEEAGTGKQLRTHLVSDLPFPFTSVQDYEASIRAPVGRDFVPETAFRMLTRPAVITMKGQVIEPMDESELVKKPRHLRHVVDRRIERAAEAAAKEIKL